MVTRVEAVLYLKGRPISKKNLSEITNADINSIIKALQELKDKYSNSKSAIELNEVNNSYCLELKSTLNEFVEDLLPSELKTSELRTLATIAPDLCYCFNYGRHGQNNLGYGPTQCFLPRRSWRRE